MKTKPPNPYRTLQDTFRVWAGKAQYPQRKAMWTYPKEKLGQSWGLKDLWERVAAADQIGWDVLLKATEAGIEVVYVKRAGDPPREIYS